MLSLCVLSLSGFAGESFEVSYGEQIAQKSKILGIQPLEEIVGGDSSVLEVKWSGYKNFSNDDYGAKIFLFGSVAPDKNNELLFGIGGDLLVHPDSFPEKMAVKIGSKVGYGWQSVNGDIKNVSTSANKVSYITGTSSSTPTQIKYEDDTYLLSIALMSGIAYEINNKWVVNADIGYRYDMYQVAYRNVNSQAVLNSLTPKQDNYTFSVGIQYLF